MQTLTSWTWNQSPTLTREGFETVLQSVCSHGHKLQFGYVRQAFSTGDPIKRKRPLFVRMPPDGVPRDSRGVWVRLLEKDFLLLSEVWSSKRPFWSHDLVLKSTQQNTMASSVCPSTILLVEEMKSGNEATLHFRTLGSGKRKNSAVSSSRWIYACWPAC